MSVEVEDALTFVGRAGQGSMPETVDETRPQLLAVHHVWGETLLDTQHFRPRTDAEVTAGSSVGHKWSLLGIDMGWVSEPWHRILPYLPPIWSEVTTVQRSHVFMDVPHDEERVLFQLDPDGTYVARVPREWTALVDDGGSVRPLSALIESGEAALHRDVVELPVSARHRLTVEANGVTLVAHLAPEPRPLEREVGRMDALLACTTGLWGFAGALVTLFVMFSPPPVITEVIDSPVFKELVFQQIEPESEPEPDPSVETSAESQSGSRTDDDAPDESGEPDPERNREVAESAGVFSGGAIEELLGGDGLDEALVSSVSDLIGTKGPIFGASTLRGRGSGLGSGGSADGLIGGLRSGNRLAYGSGGDFGRKRTAPPPRVLTEEVVRIGGLSAKEVDEVIRRHMSAIRYCYQRQLQREPGLGGKVVVKFTIAKDGSVSSSAIKHSSLGNADVGSCLVGRFHRMQFPKPKGGGIAIISYPFVFAPE